MSAALKTTTILSSLALVGAGAAFTLRQPRATDFSANALAAAEHGVSELTSTPKAKLPENFWQFTLGGWKVGNAKV